VGDNTRRDDVCEHTDSGRVFAYPRRRC